MIGKKFNGIDEQGNNTQYQIITTYQINDKNFVLYKKVNDNSKQLEIYAEYYYTNDNTFTFHKPNEEEKLFINELLKQIPEIEKKQNYIDFGTTKYNNKVFKVIFDKKTGLRLFFEIIEKNYYPPTPNDEEYLNQKYNEEKLLFTLINENRRHSYHEPVIQTRKQRRQIQNQKRKAKILNKVISFVTFGCIITAFTTVLVFNPNSPIKSDLQKLFINKQEQAVIIDDLGTTKATNDLLTIILNSKHFTNEEKTYLSSYKDIYNDNSQFFDMQSLELFLPKLLIIYDKDNQANYRESLNNNVMAVYNNFQNSITIFCDKSFNEMNEYEKRYFIHEWFHALSQAGFATNSVGFALNEGITETLTSEYLKSYSNIYYEQQTYTRMLCEIINPKIIINAYFSHDVNILIEELNKIFNDDVKGIKLLKAIDDEMNNSGLLSLTPQTNEEKENEKNAKNEISTLFNELFSIAKGYPIENDILMSSYIDSLNNTNTANSFYYQDTTNEIRTYKPYFYEAFKTTQPYAITEYHYNKPTQIPSIIDNTSNSDETLVTEAKRIIFDTDRLVNNQKGKSI